MSQGRHGVYAAFNCKWAATSLALHPDDLAAVGPRLLIRQAEAHLFRS